MWQKREASNSGDITGAPKREAMPEGGLKDHFEHFLERPDGMRIQTSKISRHLANESPTHQVGLGSESSCHQVTQKGVHKNS